MWKSSLTLASGIAVNIRPLLHSANMNNMSRTLFGKRFFDSTGKPLQELEGLKDLFLGIAAVLGKPNIGDLLPWIRSQAVDTHCQIHRAKF